MSGDRVTRPTSRRIGAWVATALFASAIVWQGAASAGAERIQTTPRPDV